MTRDMLKTIIEAKTKDTQLSRLFDEAREYAQIYLLARQRHKGCSGTGEFMTLKEEFKDTIEKMVLYCRKKNLPTNDCAIDPDVIAPALVNTSRSSANLIGSELPTKNKGANLSSALFIVFGGAEGESYTLRFTKGPAPS